MQKQYAFWRTAEGSRSRDGKHAPMALLSEIGKLAKSSGENQLSWPLGEFHRLDLALSMIVEIVDANKQELSSDDTRRILFQAMQCVIADVGAGKPIPPDNLLRKADVLAATMLREPPKDYVLVTSLSVANVPVDPVEVSGCSITPLIDRSSFLFPPAISLQSRGTPIESHISNTKYTCLRVTTKGRTIHEAGERALKAVNLLRAIWTLATTYGSWSMTGGLPIARATGTIHIGPIHTLHFPDGRLVGDLYWSEPDYMIDQKLFDPKNGWEKIEKQREQIQRWVRRSLFKDEIEEVLLRYVLALDQRMPEVAFLQMWGIIEKLTNTVGSRYEETIRRAARLFPEKSIERDVMRSLRCGRNRFVHSGESAQLGDQLVYLVKSIVDPHLVCALRNVFRCRDLEQHGDFLGLPDDIQLLKRKRRQLTRAIHISRKELQRR